jgi:peptidoglycan-associated lipoprotein
MRMNSRTLGAVVFAVTLGIAATGCGKKKVVAQTAPPPRPQPQQQTSEPAPTPPSAARVNSFTVEPRSIERGQSATLRWSVANATDMSIDQGLGGVQANGSRQVFPSTTTTYTLGVSGPGGRDSRSVTVEVASAPPPPPAVSKPPTINGAELLGRESQDAMFDYDKYDLREDARQALQRDADLLKRILAADPSFSVTLEGHCDERGSAEYNLGLGDRRASSAKEFLVQLGVPGDRIVTISYGKERPQCTDADEACYQRNRRAHLAPGH